MPSHPVRRCAIYTRKSSEEGLEQDYNSLHAQREACEAFVRSQAGEGWRLLKTAYDDGGFSGGTMDRPALQELLANIRQGLIDVVVVYKVDRLTRSLADFARIVELFDAQGVSFVAVTQQFNTTTSMGRLTLNVLLSFAQFEREVIGERIRDKVAASKRKGMWMGGFIPMGYDLRDRKLLVNQKEAKNVRHIFDRYLELSSVRLLSKDLQARGIVSCIRRSNKGNVRGGKPFSRGALYHLLSNPIYVGEVSHKGQCHPGQHEAIVSRDLWERVQEKLRSGAARQGEGQKTEAVKSPLAGRFFDERGEPLYVQGAARGQRRYRYYVSRKLVRGDSEAAASGWRISAPEIERSITEAICLMIGDRAAVALAADEAGVDPILLPTIISTAKALIQQLRSSSEAATALSALVERVDLSLERARVSVKLPIVPHSDDREIKVLTIAKLVPLQMKRRGSEMRIVLEGNSEPKQVDLPLVRAIGRARKWVDDLISGRVQSVRELARQEALDSRSVRRLIPLGFLAPRIIDAIADGRQPAELTLEALTRRIDLPLLWSAQEETLGSHSRAILS